MKELIIYYYYYYYYYYYSRSIGRANLRFSGSNTPGKPFRGTRHKKGQALPIQHTAENGACPSRQRTASWAMFKEKRAIWLNCTEILKQLNQSTYVEPYPKKIKANANLLLRYIFKGKAIVNHDRFSIVNHDRLIIYDYNAKLPSYMVLRL